MSGRSSLMLILLVVVFAAPMVYHEMKSREGQLDGDPYSDVAQHDDTGNHSPFRLISTIQNDRDGDWGHANPQAPLFSQADQADLGASSRNLSARPQIAQAEQPFQPASFNASSPALRASYNASPVRPHPMEGPPVTGYFDQMMPVQPPIDFSQMTPDYGAAQTFVFPGNAYGPDLTAPPLENLPVTDFNEVFRFDISRQWVQQRWKRVSTVPATSGLSGMRVALVTGTHSWDLHGSLTYYFDERQQLQRITFRGWAGDPQKLLSLLTTKFSFAQQPTTLAGFYLAKSWRRMTGGLLMKTPDVLQRENVVQQVGLVMEINNPNGSFELSEEFRALIAGSHPSSN